MKARVTGVHVDPGTGTLTTTFKTEDGQVFEHVTKGIEPVQPPKDLESIKWEFHAMLAGCPRCRYDESDGSITDHCITCCRAVTALAYEHFGQ